MFNADNSIQGKNTSWRGCSMEAVYGHCKPFDAEHMPPVIPSKEHTVLYELPINNKDTTRPPKPWKRDSNCQGIPCVRLPHSEAHHWQKVSKALQEPIRNSYELEARILSYQSNVEDKRNFQALHKLFEEQQQKEAFLENFYNQLLPHIISLALRLPELLQAPIPLLKQSMCHTLSLSQEQISCLLANAFLCTYPARSKFEDATEEFQALPDINFIRLFRSRGACVEEKLKCILHYFCRVCPSLNDVAFKPPRGCVTFERRFKPNTELPDWSQCSLPLAKTLVHIDSQGTIEDQGLGLLQLDFANKSVGGGVLGSGCVQEEIRFAICPELIAATLFTEFLQPTEVLLILGCERYSNYRGYNTTFQWQGNHEDTTPCGGSLRRKTFIVAMDALALHQLTFAQQFREDLMQRELNKAYVGFWHPLHGITHPGVATGNWGCGAFGGDARLKFLLQLMACTVTQQSSMVYFTMGNEELRDELFEMFNCLKEHDVAVKDLWLILKKIEGTKIKEKEELYPFLYQKIKKLKAKQTRHCFPS
ncbi:poly(ADP-ribose) glycohydrolase [Stomoxys calcitrans]|uniref:poly(ADP-ribose) glycohydrolase n=1 Tax=Stomoxys calcitrans TaxID=35570 RepID=UPI0027E2C2C5|nr:poly(ADP-ribose) glycohydrolase [Stomoxys calcitrans]